MVRSLLAVGFLALAVSARAGEDFGNYFDGAGGTGLELASLSFGAVRAAAGGGSSVPGLAPQSGADLYYFTPEEAAQAAQRYGIQRNIQGFTFDRNVPAAIQTQMLADLAFMGGIKASATSPLHQQIYGKADGSSYTKFFESRVSAIGMHSCGSAKAVACVIPMLDPSKMWLTQNFVKFSHPQISRMMIVYHEARHTETENGNFHHATCPNPFKDAAGNDMKSIWTGALLAGEPACDVTPFGSYGSSTIMLKNIAKSCSNCTDKVRMDAALYGDDQLNRITDAAARRQMEADLR